MIKDFKTDHLRDKETYYQRQSISEEKVSSYQREKLISSFCTGFPGGSEVKASACKVGDLGSIPGSGRSPGERNGNPLQYSCLGSPMDRGAWQTTVHGVTNSQTQQSD